jgi:hypothetical protein
LGRISSAPVRAPARRKLRLRGHGSTVWIRCIAHHEGWFEHVDGGGDVYRYRLVPLPPRPGD